MLYSPIITCFTKIFLFTRLFGHLISTNGELQVFDLLRSANRMNEYSHKMPVIEQYIYLMKQGSTENQKPNMMLSTNLLSAILNFSICLVIYGMLCKNRRHRLPYPPGPRGLLVAGNMFNMPKPDEAAKYLAYAKEFGEQSDSELECLS